MRPIPGSSTVVLGAGAVKADAAASDAVLVRRFQAGQRDALIPIIERHEASLRRLLLMLWDDRHEVDDLCQEVFVRLMEHLPGMSPGDSLRPWLFRIAVNLVRDRARRRKVRRWFGLAGTASVEAVRGPAAATDAAAEQRELVARLRVEVQRLDRALREVVVLRDLQGMLPQEVGELLGIPARVVNDRLYRARRRLAERLGTPLEREGP